MKIRVYVSLGVMILGLSACGGGGSSSSAGNNTPSNNGDKSVAAKTSILATGDAACPNGGILVETGIDENGNGVLDNTEVDNSEKVCNGAPGSEGLSALVATSTEPVGSNCSYGGVKIESGIDNNSDSILNAAEVTSTSYLCNTASSVAANGYAVTDAWGEVWDGLSRPLATYADANTVCNNLGGRLPTVSELYRNNHTTGLSSSSISSSTNNDNLWTLIPGITTNTRQAVRLSDGVVTSANVTSKTAYRCVWPDTSPAGFDSNACFGSPGSECESIGVNENIDAADRPALPYASAAAECAFYKGNIPVLSSWDNILHAGLGNGSNQWLQTANATYWYNGGYGTSLVRWSGTATEQWNYEGGKGAYGVASNLRNFRCIGNAQPSQLIQASAPVCNGGCFNTSDHGSPLIMDSQDRAVVTHAQAAEACRALGAELPNHEEMSSLIHAGLPNGSNTYLWLTDPIYYYSGGYANALARWAGNGDSSWVFDNTEGGYSQATVAKGYRCMWRARVADLPTCTGSQGINRSQNTYQCATLSNGDSANQANGSQFVDNWGNAWDGTERAANTYSAAANVCSALGARLPTATEIYAVRANQSIAPSIGDNSATNPLWTKTASTLAANHIQVKVSDGIASNGSDAAAASYRCIWPGTKGNVLSDGSCYGNCFSGDSSIIADSHDRPALPVASAIEECQASGGRLPDLRETQKLIHEGWTNPSNTMLWVDESMYWYSGNLGYAQARWDGTNNTGWQYEAGTKGGVAPGSTFSPFRCVYSSQSR